MTRRIAIVNVYGDDNRGSAALNLAAIRVVQRSFPGAEIGLVTINEFDEASRASKYRHTLAAHPEVKVLAPLLTEASLRFGANSSLPIDLTNGHLRLALARETSDFLDGADLVMSRGGVIYRRSATLARTAGLLRRTAPLRYAQARDIPTVFLGLHAGAIGGRLAERTVRQQFERAALVLPRGPLSTSVVQRAAPRATVWTLPDSVFAASLTPKSRDGGLSRTAVLSLSDPALPHVDDVVRAVNHLIEHGHADNALVVVQVDGDDSDVSACRELVRRLPSGTGFIDDDLSPDELVSLYGSAATVISSRLHVTIFGLIGGTPSFPIDLSRDRKAIDTYTEIGLDHQVLDPASTASWPATLDRVLNSGRAPIEAATLDAERRYDALTSRLESLHSEREAGT